MAKAYSGLGRETGGANHPQVNDINQFGQYLSHEERTKWLMDNVGLSKQDAEKGSSAIHAYTGSAYDDIHNGTDTVRGDIIDNIIHNAKSPVFTGEQYRGLYISQDRLDEFTGGGVKPSDYLQNIIKTGVWKEPGVSSFSSTQATARSFGKFDYSWKDSNDVSVMLTYKDGKSGMPIKHMSGIPGENEVLHSGRQMRNGLDIVDYKWKHGKKGTELHITVTDRKK